MIIIKRSLYNNSQITSFIKVIKIQWKYWCAEIIEEKLFKFSYLFYFIYLLLFYNTFSSKRKIIDIKKDKYNMMILKAAHHRCCQKWFRKHQRGDWILSFSLLGSYPKILNNSNEALSTLCQILLRLFWRWNDLLLFMHKWLFWSLVGVFLSRSLIPKSHVFYIFFLVSKLLLKLYYANHWHDQSIHHCLYSSSYFGESFNFSWD